MSTWWPSDIRGSQTPPSEHANAAIFWTCLPWGSLWPTCTCTEWHLPHTWGVLPTPQTALLLRPTNIPFLAFGEASLRVWDSFSSLLTWLPHELTLSLLQTSASQRLACCALGKRTWFGNVILWEKMLQWHFHQSIRTYWCLSIILCYFIYFLKN